jgi:methylenetetrahydrofolate--tRNA-(uracil-5-)-methyltransferase
MERDEYDAFMDALLSAERVISREFEQKDLFCACQPIEEVARTGHDSIRFGALKPVGLTDPRTGRRPWAAVQLRAENAQRTAYNLVGFQTNLTWPEQRRVFRMIPGLAQAEFLRYGVMHRNSFVDSPHALDATFAIPGSHTRLAGQITGTEGYVEAIASGLLAALNTYAELSGLPYPALPQTGVLGSLVAYATNPATVGYQPMHVNFGLVPPLEDAPRRKDDRRRRMAERARTDMAAFVEERQDLFAVAGQESVS